MKISDPKKLTAKGIKNIIFDWGGVITNLHFDILNKSFENLGISNFVGYFSSKTNKFLVELEVGDISNEVFKNEICKLSGKKLSEEEIYNAWYSVLGDTPHERIETIIKLRDSYRVFLLSNTNALHADYYNKRMKQEHGENSFSLFEKIYYSHELGMRKPGIEIFEHVIADAGIIPEQTIFIDDLEANIDSAVSVGMNGFHLANGYDISEVFKDW